MIRVERGEEVDGAAAQAGRRHGVFYYYCPQYALVEGYSRQLLLDACRQLKLLLGVTAHQQVGIYREGAHYDDRDHPLRSIATTCYDRL